MSSKEPMFTYASKTRSPLPSRSRASSGAGNAWRSLQHLYPSMDKAIASDEWPEPSGPKANTGCSVGRMLNRDAPSLLIAPIVERVGSIEYELVDLASRRWLRRDRLVARTSSSSNWWFIQRSMGPRQ